MNGTQINCFIKHIITTTTIPLKLIPIKKKTLAHYRFINAGRFKKAKGGPAFYSCILYARSDSVNQTMPLFQKLGSNCAQALEHIIKDQPSSFPSTPLTIPSSSDWKKMIFAVICHLNADKTLALSL